MFQIVESQIKNQISNSKLLKILRNTAIAIEAPLNIIGPCLAIFKDNYKAGGLMIIASVPFMIGAIIFQSKIDQIEVMENTEDIGIIQDRPCKI